LREAIRRINTAMDEFWMSASLCLSVFDEGLLRGDAGTRILGVDELMEMARTCVNVIGNCLPTVVVARWEGAFRPTEWIARKQNWRS